MQVIGHRGSSPENTLRGIENALENGAHAIEFDVARTACGSVVVIHDHLVDRTTNGEGYVSEHDLASIAQLDAGNGSGGGEPVPTLERALDLIDRRVTSHIEIKNGTCVEPVSKILGEYLLRGWQPTDFLVSSFDHHALLNFKQSLPKIPIAPIISAKPLDYAQFAVKLGATTVTLNHEFVDQDFVSEARQQGMEIINTFTVNHPREMLRMAVLGVDGIFTDDVPLALQTVG